MNVYNSTIFNVFYIHFIKRVLTFFILRVNVFFYFYALQRVLLLLLSTVWNATQKNPLAVKSYWFSISTEKVVYLDPIASI